MDHELAKFIRDGPHSKLQDFSRNPTRPIPEDVLQRLADGSGIEVPTFDLHFRGSKYKESFFDNQFQDWDAHKQRRPIEVRPLSATKRNLRPSQLELLPLEIRCQIFDLLDLDSLANSRLTSYKVYIGIESLISLLQIREHASHVMRILKHEGLSSFHSIGTLRERFMSSRCICGKFGPYIFLLTGMRCCHYCLFVREEFDIMEKNEAIEWFGWDCVKDLSESYTNESEIVGNIIRSPVKQFKYVSTWEAKKLLFRKSGIEMFSGMRAKSLDIEISRNLITFMPYSTPTAISKVERGYYCIDCRRFEDVPLHSYDTLDNGMLWVKHLGEGKTQLTISARMTLLMHQMKKNIAFTKAELKEHIRAYCAETFTWEQHRRKSYLWNHLAERVAQLNFECGLGPIVFSLAHSQRLLSDVNQTLAELHRIEQADNPDTDSPFNFKLMIV